jgi:4-hydroxy-tetrahydrodipicolinate synthase
MSVPLDSIDRFRGVFSLLLTPFQSSGAIDWDVYDRYVDWQLSFEPQGLFGVCGTSEMKWLTVDERVELVRRAVKRANGTPVVSVVNADEDISRHSEELLRLTECGIDAVMLVPPPVRGSDQQLKDYYAGLSGISTLPVFIYEWPLRNDYLIEAKLYKELVRDCGISGIKDTTCTPEGIGAKIVAAPDSIVYQANMAFMLDAIEIGAGGIMAINSAAAAGMVIELWNTAVTDREHAENLHADLVCLNTILRAPYPVTAKYLASLQGVPIDLHCRWPNNKLSREDMKTIEIFYKSRMKQQ